mgnify:CR=1 FL=1
MAARIVRTAVISEFIELTAPYLARESQLVRSIGLRQFCSTQNCYKPHTFTPHNRSTILTLVRNHVVPSAHTGVLKESNRI